MKTAVLFQNFLQAVSNNVAWACAIALILLAIYLTARELVADAWLGGMISDAALGLCQWFVLLSSCTVVVMLLIVFMATSAIEAYWAYYYPWSIFMT